MSSITNLNSKKPLDKSKLTLVLLHYFSGSAASWQWLMRELEPDVQCIALDLPGFGSTPPLQSPSLKNYSDFVQQHLANLDLEAFVLIGHSMGGKIALQIAAAPDVKGLHHVVLIAPSPPTQEPMPEDERQRLLNHHPSRENAQTTAESATQVSLSASQYQTAIQTHTQAASSAWRWWLLEGMNHSIANQMPNVRVPITVVASHDDPVIPYETIQQEVMPFLPSAKLVDMSGVGHLMPLEAPKQVAEILRQCI